MASHLPHLTLKLALLDRGIESFTIEYTSASCVFRPGETVHGHIVITLKDAIKAKAVIVNMIGKAKTSWTVWEQYSSNRSTHSEAIPYSADEIYIDSQAIIWHGKDGEKQLNPGVHRFPFLFTIPANCPPSYEGSVGFIRYYCKAKIDRPWKFDDTTRAGFTVLPHFDLNSVCYASIPMVKDFEKQIGFLCFKHGELNANVTLSKSGYVPGERVVLTVEITNGTTKNVARVETALMEITTFTAHRGRLHHFHYGLGTRHSDTEKKKETRTVVQYIEEFKVSKNCNATYMRMLAIPPVVPSFNVKIVTQSHFNGSISGELPMLIGTIPVRHIVKPQTMTVLPNDYLVPPQPSTIEEDNVQPDKSVMYVDSVFGKGTLVEDKDDKSNGFTPKYIYYNDMQ
uniref:Arrestin_C domain-containing protein n=1 Tax=Panagrellus redivivus TaxID=6233 RepID=A0A7E4W0E2_PANRE